jgi:hypothetical protein
MLLHFVMTSGTWDLRLAVDSQSVGYMSEEDFVFWDK